MIPCTVPIANNLVHQPSNLDKSSCCKNPSSFFYFFFRDPSFFINSISVFEGSFFVVVVDFVMQASIGCFGGSGYCTSYRNSYCSINSLKDFKVACGNRSELNCKIGIPRNQHLIYKPKALALGHRRIS